VSRAPTMAAKLRRFALQLHHTPPEGVPALHTNFVKKNRVVGEGTIRRRLAAIVKEYARKGGFVVEPYTRQLNELNALLRKAMKLSRQSEVAAKLAKDGEHVIRLPLANAFVRNLKAELEYYGGILGAGKSLTLDFTDNPPYLLVSVHRGNRIRKTFSWQKLSRGWHPILWLYHVELWPDGRPYLRVERKTP